MNKVLLYALGGIVFLFLLLILRPVPKAIPENCKIVNGTMARVDSLCCADVNFFLQNDDRHFYLNRGFENDLALEELRTDLPAGTPVTLYVFNHWTPLDPGGRMAPIARIETDDEVIFSAW